MNDSEKENVRKYHNNMLCEMMNINENSLIIADELASAYNKNLLDRRLAENIILNNKNEIVITGREPAKIFVENADYISEINEVKHPYRKGISARKGIEY